LQEAQPEYYTEVENLNLSRGDQTGMWMLNFPFPYSDAAVNQQFAALSKSLAEMISTQKQDELAGKLVDYRTARRKFEKMISPDEYKYFSFQLWKEGVARYTEYRIARLAAQEYQPSKAFLALHDYQPFAEAAEGIFMNILRQLQTLTLKEFKREMVYPYGAAEALLLDQVNPKWQRPYFAEKFNLARYFDAAR